MSMQSARGFEYGVIHGLVEIPTNLIAYAENHLQGFPLSAQELLSLGAVYVNNQRVHEDCPLKPEDYVRIHRKPRRFPTRDVNWEERILFENTDFLLLDKPGGIPCHPTVDNTQENVLQTLKEKKQQNFYVTHRLDVPTQGLLIVAKSKEAQTRINFAFSSRKIKKIYRAWTSPSALKPGLQTHFMLKTPRAPKTVFKEPPAELCEKTEICEMRIRKNDSYSSHSDFEIELLTGRTHQIRAQMSALGFPLWGDQLYGGRPWSSDSSIALWSWQIELPSEISGQVLQFTLDDSRLKNSQEAHRF